MSYYHPSSIASSSRHQDSCIPSGFPRSSNFTTPRQDTRLTGTPTYSSVHQAQIPYNPLRRSYTAGITDLYPRSISPPRSHAEQPRSNLTSRQYADHRSVSPLGSSRFEGPASFRREPKRSLTMREVPQMGYDGYFGHSNATQSFIGAGLSRSNAMRRRNNERGFGGTVYFGGVRDARQAKRCGGDFSSAQ
jgi:hypothetical protein